MRFVASRIPPPPSRLLVAAAVALSGALLAWAPARAAAPTLSGFGVDFSSFSPDGDGAQDTVRYSYTLGVDTAVVVVEVQRGDDIAPNGTIVVTLRNASRAPGADKVTWNGRNAGGVLQADGFYWFVTTATNSDGAATATPVRVTLDTVAPQVSVVSVANPYAPLAPGADTLARITVNLAGVEAGDRLELTFTGPRPETDERSALYDVSADGLFVAAWSGSGEADGLYAVSARVFDAAGHSTEAAGPDLNLDVALPAASVTSPAPPDTNGLIRRVEIVASDRSGLDFVRMTLSADGRAIADSLCPCPVDSVGFGMDVPDSIAATDTLLVTLFLRDFPGQERTIVQPLVVDSLPPAPPVLDQLPERVVLSNLSFGGAASGSDSVVVRVNGGQAARLRVATNGRFGGTLFLVLGTNVIDAIAKDKAGNLSTPSAAENVIWEQPLGVHVPERFRQNDAIEVILEAPGRGVTVHVYTLTGKLVRTLESNSQTTVYQIPWDLKDEDGGDAGSGPYVFRIVAVQQDGSSLERKLAAVVTR